MKYKFLKQIAYKKGVHYVGDVVIDVPESKMILPYGLKVSIPDLIEQGFIEEVKETPKPRWKMGDYVTYDYGDGTKKYLSISEISLDSENKYEYNRYFSEKYLREPTREELQTYFT